MVTNDKLHPNRTQVRVHTREVPKIEYNDKDVKAYEDLNLEVPDTVGRWERRFLSKVDISKGPIERSVIAMVSLRAPDFLTQEKDKSKLPERKEFVYYQEMGEGKDWRGVPLNPVSEHIEVKYDKQFTIPHLAITCAI